MDTPLASSDLQFRIRDRILELEEGEGKAAPVKRILELLGAGVQEIEPVLATLEHKGLVSPDINGHRGITTYGRELTIVERQVHRITETMKARETEISFVKRVVEESGEGPSRKWISGDSVLEFIRFNPNEKRTEAIWLGVLMSYGNAVEFSQQWQIWSRSKQALGQVRSGKTVADWLKYNQRFLETDLKELQELRTEIANIHRQFNESSSSIHFHEGHQIVNAGDNAQILMQKGEENVGTQINQSGSGNRLTSTVEVAPPTVEVANETPKQELPFFKMVWAKRKKSISAIVGTLIVAILAALAHYVQNRISPNSDAANVDTSSISKPMLTTAPSP